MMDAESAVGVIKSVAGFTDDDTPVGEAWAVVLGELTRLRTELAEAQASREQTVKNWEADIRAMNANRETYKREIDTLRQQLAAAREGVVEKLPKFKDGPPALSGEVGYHPNEDHPGFVEYVQTQDVAKGDDEETVMFGDYGGPLAKQRYYRVSDCYSTREAALAARHPEPDAGGEVGNE